MGVRQRPGDGIDPELHKHGNTVRISKFHSIPADQCTCKVLGSQNAKLSAVAKSQGAPMRNFSNSILRFAFALLTYSLLQLRDEIIVRMQHGTRATK